MQETYHLVHVNCRICYKILCCSHCTLLSTLLQRWNFELEISIDLEERLEVAHLVTYILVCLHLFCFSLVATFKQAYLCADCQYNVYSGQFSWFLAVRVTHEFHTRQQQTYREIWLVKEHCSLSYFSLFDAEVGFSTTQAVKI